MTPSPAIERVFVPPTKIDENATTAVRFRNGHHRHSEHIDQWLGVAGTAKARDRYDIVQASQLSRLNGLHSDDDQQTSMGHLYCETERQREALAQLERAIRPSVTMSMQVFRRQPLGCILYINLPVPYSPFHLQPIHRQCINTDSHSPKCLRPAPSSQ